MFLVRRSALVLLLMFVATSAYGQSPLIGDMRQGPRGLRDTGPFTGRVAVSVLLLESEGEASLYDWDDEQLLVVEQQMLSMIAWWNRIGAGQGLDLVPSTEHFLQIIPIKIEPLDGNWVSWSDCEWIDGAMVALGHNDWCQNAVDSFNEAVRENDGADQAYTILVINDGGYALSFPGGGTAWAYLGGPHCQVTFSNGGWGPSNLGMVAGHESGHVFHALDEYSQPGHSVCECSQASNGCNNDNCLQVGGVPCGDWHDICLMAPEQMKAWSQHHICKATTCHIGWTCLDEICNQVDDDCDGEIDEDLGVETCGLGACEHSASLCVDGHVVACDPMEGASPEICNGRDDDCDGVTDPDCDLDGDGHCEGDGVCEEVSFVCRNGCRDCDDHDAAIHQGATERCNGADDDCDGATDEEFAVGCTSFFVDLDQDGYGDDASARCLCGPEGDHLLVAGGDCDSDNPEVHPGRDDPCNGVDDDCDGDIDNDALDTDGDGRADCVDDDDDNDGSLDADDCEPLDASVHPGATETCNGVDDDCDGEEDEAVFDATGKPCSVKEPGDDGCALTSHRGAPRARGSLALLMLLIAVLQIRGIGRPKSQHSR